MYNIFLSNEVMSVSGITQYNYQKNMMLPKSLNHDLVEVLL